MLPITMLEEEADTLLPEQAVFELSTHECDNQPQPQPQPQPPLAIAPYHPTTVQGAIDSSCSLDGTGEHFIPLHCISFHFVVFHSTLRIILHIPNAGNGYISRYCATMTAVQCRTAPLQNYLIRVIDR